MAQNLQHGKRLLSLVRSSSWLLRSGLPACNRGIACGALAAGSQLRPTIQSSVPAGQQSQPWSLQPLLVHVSPVRRFCAAPGSVVSFPLAQTGEGISECELMRWLVQEGDVVEEFQPICEVQSDKASIEITSRYAGQITKLHYTVGDLVKVGAALMDIQLPGGSSAAGEGAPAAAADAASSSTHQPSVGSSSSSKSSADVFASPAVRRLARELTVPLDQVTPTGPGGRITKEDVEAYAAGSSTIGTPASPAPHSTPSAAATAAAGSTSSPKGPAGKVLGVVAKAVAQAAGVPPAAEQQAAAVQQVQASVTQQQQALGHPSVPEGAEAGPGGQFSTSVPLRGYRRAMVKSSTEAAHIPMFHYFDEVSMDNLMATRGQLKDEAAMQGTKLTFLPFIVKALSLALLKHPEINSCLASGGDALLQHHTHNIGVAMATASGLVVPNVKQVETKSIPEIAMELQHLQQLASVGKLSSHDVHGGSMTVSNIGTVGGTNATPLVNPPEAVIVALGRVQALPRYDSTGTLVKRHLMAVSWGGDHRVVDGAGIATFHNTWKQLVEEAARMLLHLR